LGGTHFCIGAKVKKKIQLADCNHKGSPAKVKYQTDETEEPGVILSYIELYEAGKMETRDLAR
jgi:hypothetical protein